MTDAMSHESRHPLDVDLADFAGDLVETAQKEPLEEHLSRCLLCRIKLRRLRDAIDEAPREQSATTTAAEGNHRTTTEFSLTTPGVSFQTVSEDPPAPGQLWAAGTGKRLLVLVLRERDGRVFVAPVTFDTAAADDETIVLAPALSPFEISIALYPMLAAEVPMSSLVACFGRAVEASDLDELLAGTLPGTTQGDPISGPTDPRIDFRQILVDDLGALEEVPADPEMAADAPPPRPENLASALAAELHDRRGLLCKLYRLSSWEGVAPAYSKAWIPVATVDELGTVIVVFDTPSGLTNDEDFDTAISVLTRYNASAVAVLSSSINSNAKLYDATTLSYSISVPSGQASSPGPLLSGLAPVDIIAKFLDQNSSWTENTWLPRASTTPSNVVGILADSATSAIEEVARQGRRARIGPKVAGYASIEHLAHDLENVLRSALSGQPVAQRLSDLAKQEER
jgi:hypothetical protein